VLGPLLFIIYIDDLTDVLPNCSMCLYADDLLLYRSIHSPTDYQVLQADIDALTGFQPNLTHLYVALIHPNLECATAVWDPHLSKEVQNLNLFSLLHVGSVPKVGMMPIVTCCTPKLLKMCHLYKIVHGFIDFPNAPLVYKS